MNWKKSGPAGPIRRLSKVLWLKPTAYQRLSTRWPTLQRLSHSNIRHDAIKEAKRLKETKEFSEDDVKRTDNQVTELIGEFQKQIDELHKAKETEIMTV